jgi:phage baseplate assembly protein W
MASEFLGKGWKFPITAQGGKIAVAEYEESIRDSIWLVLSTAKGERVMRPDFGCGIHDMVFAPNNAGTRGRIEIDVREALLKWEPRIIVDKLDVSAGDRGELILIQIDYRVRTTNSRFNLVYPFYLERSAS